jgi:hypothetical protein
MAGDERPADPVTPPRRPGTVHRRWLGGIEVRQFRSRVAVESADRVATMEDGRLA